MSNPEEIILNKKKEAFFSWVYEQTFLYGDDIVEWWKLEGCKAFYVWAEKRVRNDGMKYHSEGLGKNKKIRRERNKPLPLKLMQAYIPTQFGHTGECLSDACDCIIGRMKNDSKRP